MMKYFIILLITPFVASANGEGYSHMMDWYMFGGWGMFIVPIFWILLLFGIIFLVLRGSTANKAQPPQEKSKSALEILRERYASGEINKEKFDEMKKNIEE